MNETPNYIDTVVKLTPAIVSLVVGAVACGIAFFQFRIARDKLRFDLFSKRLEAYEKLQEFFTSVLREGAVIDAALPVLAEARYKSRFIFGPEIAEYFTTIWTKAGEMIVLRSKIYGPDALPVGPDRSKVCDELAAKLHWMFEEMNKVPSRYSKYLSFR